MEFPVHNNLVLEGELNIDRTNGDLITLQYRIATLLLTLSKTQENITELDAPRDPNEKLFYFNFVKQLKK